MNITKISEKNCFRCEYFKSFDESYAFPIKVVFWDEMESKLSPRILNYLDVRFEDRPLDLPLYIVDYGDTRIFAISPSAKPVLKKYLELVDKINQV